MKKKLTFILLLIVLFLTVGCATPRSPEYDYDSTPTHDGEEYGGFQL